MLCLQAIGLGMHTASLGQGFTFGRQQHLCACAGTLLPKGANWSPI